MLRIEFAVALGVSINAVAFPAAAEVTFNKDVAPIVFAHCASCHRPGEIGPFSLLSYRDARQRATQIASVTARRVMPPWKPEPGKGEFINRRVLSDEQIRTIQVWVEEGSKEGEPADLPPLPQWGTGWQLGDPDLVVTMPEPYVMQADGTDVFRTFVLPIPTDRVRFVRGVEFRPGNPRAVHHANFGVDRTGSSRRLDSKTGEPGYAGGMVPDAAYPPGHMLGWTPGQTARPSPDGAPWRLERDSDLVVQLHMQPTGKPEAVQVSVGLFFTDQAPVRAPVGLRLGSQTIDIPAGDSNYVVTDSYVLPVDVDVLAIQPHAHNLARRMEGLAILPDGTARPLISIGDWDFRWQEVYRYAEPLVLPKGATISMRFTYDNSPANPRNPHHPPARVVWGQNTSDEMGDLWLQVMPRSTADFTRLSEDIDRKKRGEDLAAYTKLLNQDPTNPLRHDAVALLYLQSGRAADAIEHLRTSLDLNEQSAPAHYNLGLALSMQRDFGAATAEFREALRLDPDHADAHNNLGAMLHLSGRPEEAAVHYRRAIALRADNAEAHNNLAHVMSMQGRVDEAAAAFREALHLRPEFPSALAGLAWVLATSPGRTSPGSTATKTSTEAVDLAERAAALTANNDATALDALAAAYAADGRFDRAVATARAAIEVATRNGMAALATDIRPRLELYERRTPYRVKVQ